MDLCYQNAYASGIGEGFTFWCFSCQLNIKASAVDMDS